MWDRFFFFILCKFYALFWINRIKNLINRKLFSNETMIKELPMDVSVFTWRGSPNIWVQFLMFTSWHCRAGGNSCQECLEGHLQPSLTGKSWTVESRTNRWTEMLGSNGLSSKDGVQDNPKPNQSPSVNQHANTNDRQVLHQWTSSDPSEHNRVSWPTWLFLTGLSNCSGIRRKNSISRL